MFQIPTPWLLVVELVQHMFTTGEIPEELMWSHLAILPKGGGGFRGIGLLETLWKLVEIVIDNRVKAKVKLHDILHGFVSKRGTGTAILEAKLQQELASIEQAPLFSVFIDLRSWQPLMQIPPPPIV